MQSIGPKQVLTRQAQGYRVERRRYGPGDERMGGVEPLDRVVLCQVYCTLLSCPKTTWLTFTLTNLNAHNN